MTARLKQPRQGVLRGPIAHLSITLPVVCPADSTPPCTSPSITLRPNLHTESETGSTVTAGHAADVTAKRRAFIQSLAKQAAQELACAMLASRDK